MHIIFVGAGNVAHHLAAAFEAAGHQLKQVFSRTLPTVAQWPFKTEFAPTTAIEQIKPDADLYVIAVADDAIPDVATRLKVNPQAIVVHTSGTVGINYLRHFERHGIFYPLQTFSRLVPVDITQVPFVLATNKPDVLQILQNIVATSFRARYYLLSEQQRQYLHLAAVFVNNFTNYLNIIANDILAEKQISFDLLKPLIQETAAKICRQTPLSAQTGPAKRGDRNTLQQHQILLQDYPPDFAQVYILLSKLIENKFGQ